MCGPSSFKTASAKTQLFFLSSVFLYPHVQKEVEAIANKKRKKINNLGATGEGDLGTDGS